MTSGERLSGQEVVNKDKIIQLTKDFIMIPSVKGNNEAIDMTLSLAKKELDGFAVEEFVEPSSGTKSLLFFNTGRRPENFRILLNGHLDVVSAMPEQFNPYIADGKLYGRGSSDMKAAATVELLVFKHLAQGLLYPIGLQLVTDEETGGFNGTGYQVKQGVRANLVISGESTELDINNERKGVLVLELTTHGKSAHAAYLYQGDNAVVKMARFITDLSEAFPIPVEEEWITTLNIAGIYTQNNEHNKVPDKATALLDFRHIPLDTKDNLRKKVKDLAPDETDLFTFKEGVAPYTDPNHPDLVLLSKCIESVTGKPAKFIRKSGSSDSRHFAEFGSTTIDFGPRGVGLHTDVEYGDIESYTQYAQILTQFLTRIK